MARQALVIGLGQFGMTLASELSRKGVEVLAVDNDEERVQMASVFAADAAVFDATRERSLARAAPEQRDLCVCAMGEQSREASILCTALLRQMGAPLVVARASNDLHERILHRVGAHLVVNPERAFGERLAWKLAMPGVVDELPLGEDLLITQVKTPAVCVGRSLIDLALPKRFGVTVAAIRRRDGERQVVVRPGPKEVLRADDVLVIVSEPDAVTAFLGGR